MPELKSGTYRGGWFDERNQRRKETYHSDANYRAKANRDAREGYRKSAQTKPPFDPRTSLPKLETIGTVRLVESASGSEEVLTFSKTELAEALGRPVKQVQQWSSDSRLPRTKMRGKVVGTDRNWIDVYSLAEVKAIIGALGEFLSDMIYFRKDHVEAIRNVHDAVDAIRAEGA